MSEAKNLMAKKTILVLEDGSVYEGYSFGAETSTYGEVVFNASMTGYQEMLTDPSYAGQILVPTYPLIGNYGINETDFESRQIQVRGFAVREHCSQPSHWRSTTTLHEFLLSNNIPGISGIDTRALTRHIRSAGAMMGILTSEKTAEEALEELKSSPDYDSVDFVGKVSTEKPYQWQSNTPAITSPSPRDAQEEQSDRRISLSTGSARQSHIVVVDLGVKYSTLRILSELGCQVTVVPCGSSAEDILAFKPDGIMISPGPGNPALLGYVVKTITGLWGKKPMVGVGLGQNLIGQAFGARNYKLKFGHRGGYPVRDLATGKVYITTQNHGYAVDADSLEEGLEVSHVNLNDGTVEGLRHRELPVMSFQYCSEAYPGPQDNLYLFERFLEMVREVGQ
jgi:carbamoyl-phosphate synthase small subunit